jgi:peptidoglycan/xylan/chitin deacetylase (PgdA/CDA1 family)
MRGMWRVHRARELATQRTGGCRRRVRRGVALTFDDGPHPEYTPALLDLLAAADVRATFFMVGAAAEANPHLVQRAVDEGHVVGSHTRSHPELKTLGLAEIRREIDDGRTLVGAAAGAPNALFRPCKGYVDLTVAAAMRAERDRPWLWTREANDWVPGITAGEIVDRLSGLRDGDVVLLHDRIEQPFDPSTLDRSATLEAVPRVIERIRTAGLAFTTLDAS